MCIVPSLQDFATLSRKTPSSSFLPEIPIFVQVVQIPEALAALRKAISIGEHDQASRTGYVTTSQLLYQMGNHEDVLYVVDEAFRAGFTQVKKITTFLYPATLNNQGFPCVFEAIRDICVLLECNILALKLKPPASKRKIPEK